MMKSGQLYLFTYGNVYFNNNSLYSWIEDLIFGIIFIALLVRFNVKSNTYRLCLVLCIILKYMCFYHLINIHQLKNIICIRRQI
jgi:hypothetical protein